jgi:hypothetical protein
MSNFSINQSRHLYVAKSYSETITEESAVGAIGGVKVIDDTLGKQFMFLYKGADTVLRSDLIQLKNLDCVKAIKAADMVTPMKKVKIALDATVNEGDVASGQDYVLSIVFRNFFSSGDASQYFKDAVVHGTANMTATQFYAAMVTSLNAAFSREIGATKTSNPYVKFTSDANGIYIEEKPQEWALGTKKARRVMFDVFCSTIYSDGDDFIWGTVTDQTPAKASATVGTNAVGNGQQIADLEWFCMGERGDQYRMKGWPNVIPTTYLVDPTQQYHVLELHFAFTDSGVNSYRTEKEITVVAPATADGKTALNNFIGAINTATGLEIDTLE